MVKGIKQGAHPFRTLNKLLHCLSASFTDKLTKLTSAQCNFMFEELMVMVAVQIERSVQSRGLHVANSGLPIDGHSSACS